MGESEDIGEIEPIYAKIGRRLAALRRARGLTQEMLSDRAGVSANYLARTEGGYHRPNLAKIEGIAEALDVSVASLFSTEPEPSPPSSRVLPALLTELTQLSRDDQRLVLQLVRRLRNQPATKAAAAAKADKRKRR
jgi:transcriptional regulator with XRE-family HTH domain